MSSTPKEAPFTESPIVLPLSDEEKSATATSRRDESSTSLPSSQSSEPEPVEPRRKWFIVVILSFGGFNSNLSSQIVSPAIPEVAAAFQTTGAIINLNNALFILFMGVGTLFWGPLIDVYGRRWTGIIAAFLFLGCSIGTALSPNLAAFFAFRTLSALFGIAFQVIGPACIADMYTHTERGKVLGWFLLGTLIAPSIGPFLGGVIIAYRDWPMLFWFQTALVGLCCLLVVPFLPETSRRRKIKEIEDLRPRTKVWTVLRWISPLRVLANFRFLRIILLGLATSSLIWNMQSILTPVRYVINPRFNLTSPLTSGLFYLAPGGGYLAGTIVGGPWTDHIVRKWIHKRGERIPEDRLRGSFIAMGVGIPASILVYGWAIDQEKGGVALPIVSMFVQGFAQMICLPCLNTYCLEVLEGKGSDIMAGNLFVRYAIAAVGTAVCIPMIDTIGVGWMNSISALFIALSTISMACVVYLGIGKTDA